MQAPITPTLLESPFQHFYTIYNGVYIGKRIQLGMKTGVVVTSDPTR